MNVSAHRRLAGRIVAATHNKGKLAEFRDLIEPHGIEVVGAGALGLPEPEETGETFLANALIKARAAAEAAGVVALADDSGLCVVGLGGAPGIYSARWAGGGGDFAPAMARIVRELEARGAAKAVARLFHQRARAGLAGRPCRNLRGPRRRRPDVSSPGDAPGSATTRCFIPDGHARTFGEMTAAEKHGLPADGSLALSHRARAFQSLARACL